MIVLLILQWVLAIVFLQQPGHVAGQFIPAPPTCPGDTFTFRCTVTGDRSGVTIWRVGGSFECVLPHSTAGATSTCGVGSPYTATSGAEFGTNGPSFLSTLSGIATSELDGTLIECFGPRLVRVAGNMVGNHTLQILGPPSAPTLSCVDLSEDVSGAVNVTVSWTLSGGDSADFYLMNIITNAPQTPYGGLLNITTASVTQHKLTGFIAGYDYNITVHGVNCGSQEGRESEPLAIIPQVPAVPNSCNITSLSYNQSSGKLLFIYATWNSMPEPLDTREACRRPRGDIIQYQISFKTGSVVATENVNIALCTAGRCSHTFEPPSNPPSSYVSVSVAAENVVGVGAARACTTRPINITNNLLTGEMVDVSSPSVATFNCTFLAGFTGSDHCTVQYGTDPTYMNLPYSAESTETGTAGDTVSVLLRERLNSSTVYFCNLSAVSEDVTVVVQGIFTTPQYSCSLLELWNMSIPGVTFLSDVSLLDDSTRYPSCDDESVGSAALKNTTFNTATVAYYTGTTPGSTACFVCDRNSGYELLTNERVCQSNSTWSGSPITCVCTLSSHLLDWHISLIVMGTFFLVVGAVSLFIIIVAHKYYPAWQKIRPVVFAIFYVFAPTLIVIGVALWCAVGLVVANPPNDNACDTSWRISRDTLIIAGFVVSSLVLILAITQLLGLYYLGKQLSPLHMAARQGDLDKVRKLVDKGADINIKDPGSGQTPLHIAAKNHHDYTVEYLVKQLGAEPNAKDSDGVTPLHLAAEGARIQMLKSLVNQGADINVQDHNEQTPLHFAAREGHDYTVKCLVKQGAKMNIKDIAGRTPLHIAAIKHREYTVECLINQGADINVKDDDGVTPLHLAAEGARIKVVNDLVGKGADVNIKDHNGQTPLHVAAKEHHDYTVQHLIEKGADINIKDNIGMTLLHVAATEGRVNITECLIKKGADTNVKNVAEKTPLDLAVKNGHEDVAKLLRSADMSYMDIKEVTL